MDTIPEKLNAIAAKCRELLAQDVADPNAKAGWRTTVASITALEDMGEADADLLGANIVAAWEGLL